MPSVSRAPTVCQADRAGKLEERRRGGDVLGPDRLAREYQMLSAPKMFQVPRVTMNGGSLSR